MKYVKYWKSITDKNNYIYSVDMVRLCFNVNEKSLADLNHYLTFLNNTHITSYPTNFVSFKYKHLFKFDYGESSMVLGLCFNGAYREDMYKCFVEFNPNKCDCKKFWEDFNTIRPFMANPALKRWDLACDIPLAREHFIVLKDFRKYSCEMNSFSDKTEYLGCRNSVGRFKMYNKKIESKLDNDLTRLELTCDDLSSVFNNFPKVFYRPQQLEFTDLKGTDLVLYQLLLSCDNFNYYYGNLGRKMKEKLKPYLIPDSNKVELDFQCVSDLFNSLCTNFT